MQMGTRFDDHWMPWLCGYVGMINVHK